MQTTTLSKNALDAFKEAAHSVDHRYETYVRQKAIEAVDETLKSKGLAQKSLAQEDYEALVCDRVKDIKKEHTKKLSQGLFAFIGIDFLLGW